MRGSRVRVPLVALFLQQAVLASPSKVLFVCEISTSVVHGLPKPVRRVRLPYLALLFFHPPFHYSLPLFHHHPFFIIHPLYFIMLSFLLSQRKPLRTNFAVLRYNLPIFFIPLHQISERYENLISIQHLLKRKK